MYGFISVWLRNVYLTGCFCLALGAAGVQAQEQQETPSQEQPETAATAVPGENPANPYRADEGININLADADLIAESLQGIGTVRAEAIIRYREENGEFRSLEELGEVRGVGEQTLMRNSERIVFE